MNLKNENAKRQDNANMVYVDTVHCIKQYINNSSGIQEYAINRIMRVQIIWINITNMMPPCTIPTIPFPQPKTFFSSKPQGHYLVTIITQMIHLMPANAHSIHSNWCALLPQIFPLSSMIET